MKEELAQFARLLEDPIWRLCHLYSIRDMNGHVVPFEPRAEQLRYLRERHTRNIVPKARKLGLSTIIVMANLDACIFTPEGIHCAIIDLTQDLAEQKVEMARLAWAEGPNDTRTDIAAIWTWIHSALKLKAKNLSLLEWDNGSKLQAGVSFVGGTPQRLHWSEAGPLSVENPKKAARVRRQSFNAVPPDGIIDVETTMEGGTYGEAYALFKQGLENVGKELSLEDFKFHFFPWWRHPDYIVHPGMWVPTAETVGYFAELEKLGIHCTPGQQCWYERRKRTQGADMWSQFPSTPDEAIRVAVAGQVYPEVTRLRVAGRVQKVDPEPGVPLVCAWDKGIADATAGWLVQFLPTHTRWLRHAEWTGQNAAAMAEQIRAWEQELGRRISIVGLPHDALAREPGSGLSYRQHLEAAGISPMAIVSIPRTLNKWLGIEELRRMLPTSYFDLSTDIARKSETGADLPSGVGCLENYRRKQEGGKEVIIHDHTSHTADAARYVAELKAAGLHEPASPEFPMKPPTVKRFA